MDSNWGAWRPPKAGLLSRGGSPPGPPALNFSEYDPQLTPK